MEQAGKDLAGVQAYSQPNLHPAIDLRGYWMLELKDSALRHLGLTLLQNQDVIFGRGIFGIGGIDQAAFSSGQISGDVLYLDVLSEDLILFRFTLSVSKDYLSGSYYAFDAQAGSRRGGSWQKICVKVGPWPAIMEV